MAKEKPQSPSASPAFRLQLAAVRSSVSGGHARPAPDTGGGLYTGERREGQPLLSGSIATSRAASRHNSAGVRREPSSSKMRTSFACARVAEDLLKGGPCALRTGGDFVDANPRGYRKFHGRSRQPITLQNENPAGVSTWFCRQWSCLRTN